MYLRPSLRFELPSLANLVLCDQTQLAFSFQLEAEFTLCFLGLLQIDDRLAETSLQSGHLLCCTSTRRGRGGGCVSVEHWGWYHSVVSTMPRAGRRWHHIGQVQVRSAGQCGEVNLLVAVLLVLFLVISSAGGILTRHRPHHIAIRCGG
jgi:hypothetical protein